MANIPKDLFPDQTDPNDPDYPDGKAQDVVVPSDGTGTPWVALFINNIWGWLQALLTTAGITANGNPDKLSISQYLQALKKIHGSTFDTVADMIAVTTNLIKDSTVTTRGYSAAGDGGGARYRVMTAAGYTTEFSGPPDGFGDHLSANTNFAYVLQINGTLHAEWFGIIGGAGPVYTLAQLSAFLDKTALDEVTEAIFPNRLIKINNAGGGASFRSNCTYSGGNNTVIQATDTFFRMFETSGETNFYINNIHGIGTNEILLNTIGGGLWRFNSCTNFTMENFSFNNSGGLAIKLFQCTNFTMKDFQTNYNGRFGFELQDCSDYIVTDFVSDKNGRNSVDDTFKDVLASDISQQGRGFVVGAANAAGQDQKYSIIKNGKCRQNSEYGGRCFAQSGSLGVRNLTIKDCLFEDNGAPEGDYGQGVMAAKGADVLINGNPDSDADNSQNIEIRNCTVNRSFDFGQVISMGGIEHKLINNTVRALGSGEFLNIGYTNFNARDLLMRGNRSIHFLYHLSFGSGAERSVNIDGDFADGCVNFMNGNAATASRMINVRAVHSSAVAILDENGLTLNGNEDWFVRNCEFDGFYRGVVISNTSGQTELEMVRTPNSVNIGCRDFKTDAGSEKVIHRDCQYDSVDPSFGMNGVGGSLIAGQKVQRSSDNTLPDDGYFRQGDFVNKTNVGTITNGKIFWGWVRLTDGSDHALGTDWEELWIPIDGGV